MKQLLIIFFLLLTFTSCRYNNYTPAEPNDEFTFETEVEFFESPQKADIFYLGDDVPINYRVFSNSGKVNIHIIRKTSLIYTLAEYTQNDGEFVWETSSDTNPSVHYQVKIESSEDPNVFILSERFGLISK